MNTLVQILSILIAISSIEAEKRFLKVENCTADAKLVRIQRCELANNKMSIVYDIIKPIASCTVEFCFHKSENGKFRPLGKCQRFDRCRIFNLDVNLTPIMKRLTRFIKYAGSASLIPSCPLHGREEYLDMTLNANIMGFLPKGVLKISVRNFNDDGVIFAISIIFMNS
ncbi:unnamed protein product [Chironomus riparius]|uniref:Uncharacterized protein n=1 Tax=Chironomus riparius TaxID=315576 RepID=A0A9N9S8M5_9DIPT|nr:unnamed protein product [Chironomus riparius]